MGRELFHSPAFDAEDHCFSVLKDRNAPDEYYLFVSSLCFSPDGKFLAAGGPDTHIRVREFLSVQIRLSPIISFSVLMLSESCALPSVLEDYRTLSFSFKSLEPI